MNDARQHIHIDLSVPEAVAGYKLLLARPYIADEGETGLFRKLEQALHDALSIEDMEALSGGVNLGRN